MRKKNKNVSDNKTESEVGKRLKYVEDFESKINEKPKTKYFYTFFSSSVHVLENMLNRLLSS